MIACSYAGSKKKHTPPAASSFRTRPKKKPMEGEILAVGPGSLDEKGERIPLDVKVGDLVLFGKWSGTETKIDGEELVIMKESDIIGIIEATGSKSARKAA
jgi:chaperonin GroES